MRTAMEIQIAHYYLVTLTEYFAYIIYNPQIDIPINLTMLQAISM